MDSPAPINCVKVKAKEIKKKKRWMALGKVERYVRKSETYTGRHNTGGRRGNNSTIRGKGVVLSMIL